MKKIWSGALLIAAATSGMFIARADNDGTPADGGISIDDADAYKSIVVCAGNPAEEYRINIRNLKIKSYDDSIRFYNGRLEIIVAQADLKGWSHDVVMIEEPLPPADEEKDPSDIGSGVKTMTGSRIELTETSAGLRVSNAGDGCVVDVFDISGRRLGREIVINGEAEVRIDKGSIAGGRIVVATIDGTPFKIKLKN